jgi:hypothetical protein
MRTAGRSAPTERRASLRPGQNFCRYPPAPEVWAKVLTALRLPGQMKGGRSQTYMPRGKRSSHATDFQNVPSPKSLHPNGGMNLRHRRGGNSRPILPGDCSSANHDHSPRFRLLLPALDTPWAPDSKSFPFFLLRRSRWAALENLTSLFDLSPSARRKGLVAWNSFPGYQPEPACSPCTPYQLRALLGPQWNLTTPGCLF